jgi:uncharacterized protein YprB with RNaseH-like and TPR domain
MKPPIPKMKKAEILELHRWRCKHGCTGLEHYNCWLRENPSEEKIGFLDIEASNLKANFGIMLSYCIKPLGSDDILFDVMKKRDFTKGILDKRVVTNCIKDMLKFQKLIGHYSSRFDIPFIRTRAIHLGIEFPKYGDILQIDTWRMAKDLLCLHSNRQDVVAETLCHENIKTRIDPKHWLLALQGDKKALDYILHHNKMDVIQLEQNYLKLKGYSRETKKSI